MIRRLAGLPPARLLQVVLVACVVVGALAVSVPALGNAGMLLAAAGLFAALGVLAQWLWQSRQSTDWDNTFSESAPPRGADSRVSRLAVDLREAASGNAVSASRVHAALSGLAAERLRDRRGMSVTEEGRAALGPDLAAYVAGPPTTRVTAAQLAAFITILEEL